ncbi:MAG: alpha/beta hydrolase [Hyphomicrobiaceae bacterium]|nr:alpha/beta hydrolase [Hyphomicrobiaceae bacterium]
MDVGHGADCRRIACLVSCGRAGAGAGIVWLPGFKSEMTSLKATALADWAEAKGRACTRLDYSGHGRSPGRVEDGTIGRWLDEVTAVFTRVTNGPQVVVGSSMGGYLALLLLRRLMAEQPDHAARIRALVLIAPAWDMTERLMEPRLGEAARRDIAEKGVWLRPSRYGDGPYPITRRLLEEGREHLIGMSAFDPGRPVRILHGLQDPDVPWEHTLDLVAHLDGDWTEVTAVPDGDHRLSRDEDLTLLLRIVEEVAA